MSEFVIVCKSYRPDVRRVQRMVESAMRFNSDNIRLVLSVPKADDALFRNALPTASIELVHDEAIALAHPQAISHNLLERLRTTPGTLSQQVVKSEAWRLVGCQSYLCVDSDCVFLRPFSRSDFLTPAGHPYTVMHQARELLQLAIDRGREKIYQQFVTESTGLRDHFGRQGPHYDYGPSPMIWSAKVWNDLHEQWLAPRAWTLWDAIDKFPAEIRWYGEALLHLRSIPLDPIEPLFRVYHYDWQYDLLHRWGETPERVAQQYMGVVYQSNWEIALDTAGTRSAGSRWARRLKRALRRL